MQTITRRQPREISSRLKRILVPVDFSLASQQTLDYARVLARCFGSEITLLHAVQRIATGVFQEVAPDLAASEEEFEQAEHRLQQLAQKNLRNDSTPFQTLVRNGLAAHEIVEAAREIEADLIVIATHGYTGWKHFCIGSTTERVVRTAPCAVFVVRENEHEFI